MDPMRLDDIASAARGRLTAGDPATSIRSISTEIASISTDSRTLRPGELFVALVGKDLDGHAYVSQAFARGAAAAVVEHGRLPQPPGDTPLILVEDTTHALQQIARVSRERYTPMLAAVTGSNGKTTTKDFIAALAAPRFITVKSRGSFNNHVGVPLTLLDIDQTTEFAVVELGMNTAGEIRALAALAGPQVGVITNVNPAHLEFFGSVAAIAEAKAELLEALPPDGTAVLNAGDEWVRRMGERWTGRCISFGTVPEADVHLVEVRETAAGSDTTFRCFGGPELQAAVPVPGRHNALNAAAAVAACCAIGMRPEDVLEGFERLRLSKMRFERHEWRGALIINDAYNANPESMRAAIETFSRVPVEGRRIAVLGEMRELGPHSRQAHHDAGRLIAQSGLDRVIVLDGEARTIAEAAVEHGIPADRTAACSGVAEAAALLRKELKPGDAVLIKGSRANEMERIIEKLTAPSGTSVRSAARQP